MRVLMLNYEYPPLGGGAAHANENILRAMADYHDVTVDLLTSSTGAAAVEQFAPGTTIHRIDIGKRGSLHYQSNRDLLAYAVRAGARARALLRQHRYDLCHAFFGIPCGVLAWRLKLPYIVSLRGSDVPFYNARFRVPDTLLFRRLSVHVWKKAEAVIANSSGLRELALRSSPDQPIDVIPNGVDTHRFFPAPVPHEGLKVLVVARLIQRKGIEHLIGAMDLLKGEDVTLSIAGEGNQREALEARAAAAGLGARVNFLGAVPHDRLPAIYQAHDVFVLPSLNEGMSNTVLEAMACGLPILMTNTGGAAELLAPQSNGAHIEPCAESIAARLRDYLAQPGLIRAQGARSRERAEQQGWRQVAEAYRARYDAVLR